MRMLTPPSIQRFVSWQTTFSLYHRLLPYFGIFVVDASFFYCVTNIHERHSSREFGINFSMPKPVIFHVKPLLQMCLQRLSQLVQNCSGTSRDAHPVDDEGKKLVSVKSAVDAANPFEDCRNQLLFNNYILAFLFC